MRASRLLRCATGAVSGSGVSTSPSNLSTTATTDSTSVQGTLHGFRTRDITLRVPSADHLLRVSFCSTRSLLAETICRHDLLRATGAHLDFLQLLGTHLAFTNLLASSLEGEERVETRFTGEEATILAEALALGECRAYLRPEFNAQLEGRCEPTFPLRVNRFLYRQHTPFTSTVHAALAELLQPPHEGEGVDSDHQKELSECIATAVGEDGVPFSLYSPGLAARRVPFNAWSDFFAYNTTLHAYNYWRRSDGCVPAVWMHANVDKRALCQHGLLDVKEDPVALSVSDDTPDKEAAAQTVALQRALRRSIPHSFAVVVTPLAAGAAVDQRVGQLNRALAEAAAWLHVPPPKNSNLSAVSPVSDSPLRALLEKSAEKHTTCQHVLSLVTGDYDGAHASAVAARQYSEDPAQVAAVVDPIRRALGVEDFVIKLAATEAVRTGLDFFCRCSKQNIMNSLVSVPVTTLTSLREGGSTVTCYFCGKHHILAETDWADLEKVRSAAAPAPSTSSG